MTNQSKARGRPKWSITRAHTPTMKRSAKFLDLLAQNVKPMAAAKAVVSTPSADPKAETTNAKRHSQRLNAERSQYRIRVLYDLRRLYDDREVLSLGLDKPVDEIVSWLRRLAVTNLVRARDITLESSIDIVQLRGTESAISIWQPATAGDADDLRSLTAEERLLIEEIFK